jgi:hypothetical protein
LYNPPPPSREEGILADLFWKKEYDKGEEKRLKEKGRKRKYEE